MHTITADVIAYQFVVIAVWSVPSTYMYALPGVFVIHANLFIIEFDLLTLGAIVLYLMWYLPIGIGEKVFW